MKLIKFLLFLSIAGNGIFAMDLPPKPSKEKLYKPDLTKEQLKEERSRLRPETFSRESKLAAQTEEIQKMIAQEVLHEKDKETDESVLEYIEKQKPLKQTGGIKVPGAEGPFKVPYNILNAIEKSGSKRFKVLGNKIIDTKNNNQIILEVNEKIITLSTKAKLELNKNQTILYINYSDGGKQKLLINPQQALQWLTNKLPGQKTFLLPDQAEIIRRAYESKLKGKSLAITGIGAAKRFNVMPKYVRDMLQFYLGVHVDAKLQQFLDEQAKKQQLESAAKRRKLNSSEQPKEAPLRNIAE